MAFFELWLASGTLHIVERGTVFQAATKVQKLIVHDYLLSTIRGHAKIVDTMNPLTASREDRLDRYIAELKNLSFVRDVTVHTAERKGIKEFDALLPPTEIVQRQF